MGGGAKNFTDLRVYQMAERLSDEIWRAVLGWDGFARYAIGTQIVRAADSVGANIAEGAGRGTYQDNRRFVHIARGSLKETQHFLRRAYSRGLLTEDQVRTLRPLIEELGPSLNAYLRSIGSSSKKPLTNDQ